MMALEDNRDVGGSLWASGDAGAVVRRIWYAVPAVGVVMIVVALVSVTRRDAAGVAVGVVLAAVNFRFLEISLRSLLGSGNVRPPSGSTLMFVVRWLLVVMLGFAASATGTVSGGGVIVGLFAPGVAILLEAVYQLLAAARGHRGPAGG
jgi:hypothetical protein